MAIWAEIKKALNTDLNVPLNERPVSIKDGILANDEILKQTKYKDIYDAGSKLFMNVGNNEMFMMYTFKQYSAGSEQSAYIIQSYDGVKEINLMNTKENSNAHSVSYIGRDRTNKNVYFSTSYGGNIYNMSSALFTTVGSTPYYFYAKAPRFIYATGTSLKIKDLGLNTEITVDNVYIVNKLIWDYEEYIYFIGSGYNVFRINVDTLEIENLTIKNSHKSVTNADNIIKNADGTYVLLYVNNVIKYCLYMKSGYVEEIDTTLSIPKDLGTNVLIRADAGLLILDEYLINMYSTYVRDLGSGSGLFLYKKNIKSFNDKKSNIILKKGEIVLSVSKLNKLLTITYESCKNELVNGMYKNEILEDGVYAFSVAESSYTVV